MASVGLLVYSVGCDIPYSILLVMQLARRFGASTLFLVRAFMNFCVRLCTCVRRLSRMSSLGSPSSLNSVVNC